MSRDAWLCNTKCLCQVPLTLRNWEVCAEMRGRRLSRRTQHNCALAARAPLRGEYKVVSLHTPDPLPFTIYTPDVINLCLSHLLASGYAVCSLTRECVHNKHLCINSTGLVIINKVMSNHTTQLQIFFKSVLCKTTALLIVEITLIVCFISNWQ